MHIAFFTTLDHAPWGGSEVLWVNTALYLADKGIAVSCFVPRWSQEPAHIQQLKLKGIKVYYYKNTGQRRWHNISSRLMRKAGFRTSFFETLMNAKPDYVFFSQGHSYDLGYFPDEMISELLQSNLRYSIICQNNTDYSFIPPAAVRKKVDLLYQKAHKVLFVSKRNRDTAVLHLCRDYPNLEVISNSLNLTKETIRKLSFPPTEIIRFASVANLKCSHKGQNILLHVLSQLKWKERSWQFHLYGKGEDENYLRELSEFLGLTDRVFFHGHTDSIEDVWTHNHMLLLASFGEGLPLALQEAMLLGRAAVVTDVGGNSELVKDMDTGFLANGTTFSALDDAIERAWYNRSEWEEMGKRAHDLALSVVCLEPEEHLYQLAK